MTDSPSAATILDNGVRAWDRSGLRTVRPPAAGERRLVPPGSERRTRRPRARPAPELAWFWDEVDPAAPPSAARWQTLLDMMRDARRTRGAVYQPSALARIAERWAASIPPIARRHGVSEALILAVIAVESAGRRGARSPKGAQGLMQLIPATARRFGVRDAYDPEQNIHGGAAYLAWLLEHFQEDIVLALAGYNAGEGAVRKHGGVPPYAETRNYVVRVLDALVAAEALCQRPPDTPRTACALPLPKRVPPA